MDEDISKIIRKIFAEEDANVIEEMLEIVSKDMSDAKTGRRITDIDLILNGHIE